MTFILVHLIKEKQELRDKFNNQISQVSYWVCDSVIEHLPSLQSAGIKSVSHHTHNVPAELQHFKNMNYHIFHKLLKSGNFLYKKRCVSILNQTHKSQILVLVWEIKQ